MVYSFLYFFFADAFVLYSASTLHNTQIHLAPRHIHRNFFAVLCASFLEKKSREKLVKWKYMEETERKAKGSFVYLCKLNARRSVSGRLFVYVMCVQRRKGNAVTRMNRHSYYYASRRQTNRISAFEIHHSL